MCIRDRHYCNQLVNINASDYLQRYGTYITGTVHTNRAVPPHLINEALDKGFINKSLFARNKNILLVRFVDKQDVYVCTNIMF